MTWPLTLAATLLLALAHASLRRALLDPDGRGVECAVAAGYGVAACLLVRGW